MDVLVDSHNLILIFLVIFVAVILLVRFFLFLGILTMILILGLTTIVRTLLRLLPFHYLFYFLRILRVLLVDVSRNGLPYLPLLLAYRFDWSIIRLVFLQFLICLQRFPSAVLIY
jgi:hypothetical protein